MKQKNSEKNLSQYHFFHNKSRKFWPGREPGPPRWGQRLTPWVMARLLLNCCSQTKGTIDHTRDTVEHKEGLFLPCSSLCRVWRSIVTYKTFSGKKTVFWDVTPCRPAEIYRRFRGYHLLDQSDKEAADYTVQHPSIYIPQISQCYVICAVDVV
jgi:hypothetical protein